MTKVKMEASINLALPGIAKMISQKVKPNLKAVPTLMVELEIVIVAPTEPLIAVLIVMREPPLVIYI